MPVGDIDLLREIQLDQRRMIAFYERERPRVKRMYTAKIEGQKLDVTVAVYQGEGAQEVCLYILFFSRCSLIM
jgi:hypothetical protein